MIALFSNCREIVLYETSCLREAEKLPRYDLKSTKEILESVKSIGHEMTEFTPSLDSYQTSMNGTFLSKMKLNDPYHPFHGRRNKNFQ